MTAAPTLETPPLLNVMRAVATAHIVEAAADLGLLDHLTSGPADMNTLAQACATDPSMTTLLLDALVNLGVVRHDASGRYALVHNELPPMVALGRRWSRLVDVVRSGKPLTRADSPDGASELYPDVTPLLAGFFAPAARQAAQLLPDRAVDVLDVGAGAAPWSIALATSRPAVRVTALDLPAVIATTRRAVTAASLEERFTYQPGDMFTCELHPAAYDLVLLANVCHLFGEFHIRALLQRLRPALRSGGLLAIIDAVPWPDSSAQRVTSLYALDLRLRTSSGGVHSLAAYEAWTSDAGFGPIQVEPLSTALPLCLLTCSTK